jgi:hypothetical protein
MATIRDKMGHLGLSVASRWFDAAFSGLMLPLSPAAARGKLQQSRRFLLNHVKVLPK